MLDSYAHITIRPQPRQEQFLSSSADIGIFGGGAYGGKTYSLELEPLRHINNPEFGAVMFRRTMSEITKEGGLWDESEKLYPLLNAKPNLADRFWKFPSGAKIAFSHLQYDKDKYTWKSSQIPLILFDQLEMFTESQFFYMISRNRSTCGVKPYLRASANPEPGWLANFLAWWIDVDGWAIPERSGKIRWMVRGAGDEIFWADTKQELLKSYPLRKPKSVTFVLSTIYDNQIGMQKDPDYLGNLQMQDNIEQQRLLGDGVHVGGNWKIAPSAGKVFNRDWFEIVDAVPVGGREVRGWDLAATEKKIGKDDPDFTCSCKGKQVNGVTYILDATAEQIDPAHTDTKMKNIATQDGKKVAIRFEQEGGSSGKRDVYHIVTMLQGYDVRGVPKRSDKITSAKPLAAQAFAGNVKLLRGPWNERWLNRMHAQDGAPTTQDDDMDAASMMYNELVGKVVRAI